MSAISDLNVGGVVVLLMVLGITQAVKDMLAWDGPKVKLLTLVVAAVFGGVAQALAKGMFPEQLVPYIELVYFTIAFALTAIGTYDLATHTVPRAFGRRL
jgi:hypothetical protein